MLLNAGGKVLSQVELSFSIFYFGVGFCYSPLGNAVPKVGQ